MKTIFKALLFTFIISCSNKAFSQFSIGYYQSSLAKFSVAYNFTDRLWTELRVYGNTYFEDLTPELTLCYNFVKKERHNLYVGLGGNINYLTGYVMPIGLQFTPIENFKNFSMHVEILPSFDIYEDFMFQASWGFRYKFNKN